MSDIDEALKLVRQAFEQARKKGKRDWQLMSLAVLNNRLLTNTDRKFDVRTFGVERLEELLEELGTAVAISRLDKGIVVEWKGDIAKRQESDFLEAAKERSSQSSTTAPPRLGGPHIRDDLWTAIVDYRTGILYVWDPAVGLARQGSPDEGLPVMPTVSREEVAEWRETFLELNKDSLQGAELARTLRWKEEGLPAVHLPEGLRTKWNRETTQKVRSRLQAFFGEQEEAAQLGTSSEERLSSIAPPIEPAIVDEEAVRAARDRGDTFVAGELLARAMTRADEEQIDGLLSRVLALWASPLQPMADPTALADLVIRRDEFTSANLAIALVNALHRLKQSYPIIPDEIGDIAFRVKEELCRIYKVDAKKRPVEIVQSAVARLQEALSELQVSVTAFIKTTPATAKATSVDVLRRSHVVQSMLLTTERGYLRELESLLGASFRKFCESYERQEDAAVMRRAPELREILKRYAPTLEDPRGLSKIWQAFVKPVTQHVSVLIDEAAQKGEAFLSPNLALGNKTTKTDLKALDQEVVLTFRLVNSGRGQALGITMEDLPSSAPARVVLVEPGSEFDIGPESDRLVSIALAITVVVPSLTLPIRWTCRTAMGNRRDFEDRLVIEQQSSDPDWDRILADQPYSLNPIKRRDRLYGRDMTLTQLRVAALAGASTFLWGQKRIGKTSLLQVLAAELAERSDATCIVLRMGELTSLHEGQIAHRIATRLVDALTIDVTVPAEEELGAGMGRLVPFVERLVATKPEHKFLVIVDEFDDLDPAFYTGERGKQFIKALRSLSEIGLTFFFVGSERMDTIYQRHQTDLNKWRNIALDRIENRQECKALIVEPVKGAIEFAPQAVDFIVDYCGANPFYIHNVCYQVFERCVQDHRTYVSENDLQSIRYQLLLALGATNFAHFWEDNPELDQIAKVRQSAENCIALTCIAVLGGRYESINELVSVQESLPIAPEARATISTIRSACERLKTRRILETLPKEDGFVLALPIFREWLADNADPKLLTVWSSYISQVQRETPAEMDVVPPLIDIATFPIPEDELIAISQKLVYCGHQKDAAEIRQWLRQFDDDSRIEIAFLLLKRIADRGFISEGSRSRALHKVAEMVQSRRQEIGNHAWQIVRGRLNNLCITYVDSEVKSGASTARDLQKVMRPGKCGAAGEISSWMRSHAEDDCMVVVVDDFAGSGTTLADGLKKLERHIDAEIWAKFVKEGRISTYIMFAFPEAVRKIRKSSPGIEVVAANGLGDELRALDEQAEIFESDAERRFAQEVLTQIGRALTPQSPLGFRDLGALVVFHNSAPNNTLPIFWSSGRANERAWKPLFPRA